MPRTESNEDPSSLLRTVLTLSGRPRTEIAQHLGTSLAGLSRWERATLRPDSRTVRVLKEMALTLKRGEPLTAKSRSGGPIFASRGARQRKSEAPLFEHPTATVELMPKPGPSVLSRLCSAGFWTAPEHLAEVLRDHAAPAKTRARPATDPISAGKNTYTYDAHTYHTKVPPQGIARILRDYLPQGGLVLDPFAGSGMTGVAARAVGVDVVLNELSPAASFIADRFTRSIDPRSFHEAISAISGSLRALRKRLYSTDCRECGRSAEVLYTIWSYQVICSSCAREFVLWDACRKYGTNVREHKILSEFPCPTCRRILRKSSLSRTTAKPVLLAYRCCGSQTEHPPTATDLKRIAEIERNPPVVERFCPRDAIPDGVNLSQPKRHGLTSIDRFYSARNLAAMSHLWQAVHRLGDSEIAGFAAFVFTSLYQRVTRLSEYRFWGGSGNTARFNVPYIFNEANVFVTFERKARTIQDHLETTAREYAGRAVVRTGSATDLSFLPDESVDLVFTDPPFGANINYSEMNTLWEAWLGAATDNREEAIINRHQNKDLAQYEQLMSRSLSECHRVLRRGHWMVLVFMNSAESVWRAIRNAVSAAGFTIDEVQVFDKEHGTFKQFVSENTAGCDLLLHCRKGSAAVSRDRAEVDCDVRTSISAFVDSLQTTPTARFLHVARADEIDYRLLYSAFVAQQLMRNKGIAGFATFRDVAAERLVARNGRVKQPR